MKNDPVFKYCLRISTKRIAWAVANSNAMNGYTQSTRNVKVLTWWQSTLLGVQISAGVIALGLTGGLVYITIMEKKKSKKGDVENA